LEGLSNFALGEVKEKKSCYINKCFFENSCSNLSSCQTIDIEED